MLSNEDLEWSSFHRVWVFVLLCACLGTACVPVPRLCNKYVPAIQTNWYILSYYKDLSIKHSPHPWFWTRICVLFWGARNQNYVCTVFNAVFCCSLCFQFHYRSLVYPTSPPPWARDTCRQLGPTRWNIVLFMHVWVCLHSCLCVWVWQSIVTLHYRYV